jgi:hypothetical protein
LLELICAPSVRPFREIKFLASATFCLDRKKKFNLKATRAEGASLLRVGKDVVLAGCHSSAVFDCVALQPKRGQKWSGFQSARVRVFLAR